MNDLAREAFEQWYLREIDGDPEELATEVDGEYFFHVPRTAWRAWQAAPQGPAVGPEGWKLVPVEPTTEMLGEGAIALLAQSREPLASAYRNMLAAAPEPDHIGDANNEANEPTGQLFACDTCDSRTDDPWHYSTPTNRHMHACDVCWPEVQLIMLTEAKQALLSQRGVPPEDMAAAIQLEDEE